VDPGPFDDEWKPSVPVEALPAAGWVPSWVTHLAAPVWVTGPDAEIRYLNQAGERLLEARAEELLGEKCFEIVRGTMASGESFCAEVCPLARRLEQHSKLDAVDLRIQAWSGAFKWVHLLAILIWGPGGSGPCLVHCALPADREHRCELYIEQVASRSRPYRLRSERQEGSGISARESEVLTYLAEDRSLQDIARLMHLSHATVRNHVQHLIGKLQVHSIPEAVALYLLAPEDLRKKRG